MKLNSARSLALVAVVSVMFSGCATMDCCSVDTQRVAIYENHTIPANTGISTGTYTAVDGYRYANVVVEFEQTAANEEPVSLLMGVADLSLAIKPLRSGHPLRRSAPALEQGSHLRGDLSPQPLHSGTGGRDAGLH